MASLSTPGATEDSSAVQGDVLELYISAHCPTCAYALEITDFIRAQFPTVTLRIIDIHQASEQIPAAVFATPTYLLNGRVWSLGNPSHAQLYAALGPLAS